MRELAHRIVNAQKFRYTLVVLIVVSAILQGLTTSPDLYDRVIPLVGDILDPDDGSARF